MSRDKRKKVILLFVIFVIALVVVALVLSNLSNILGNNDEETTGDNYDLITEMETVYIDGEGYLRKDNIKNYLLIGLDKSGKLERSDETYNEGNQADFILLFVIDKNNNKYNLLHINRDTMTEISRFDRNGQKSGSGTAQICLAHAYGDGMHLSCQNTVEAVENFLYGAKIDKYISASMSAVSEVNDFIGGVTVDIKEDLTMIDPAMKEGTRFTLFGDNALWFIRGRKGVGDQTNLSRMERQKQYMVAFIDQLKNSGKSSSDFIDFFNQIGDYIVSDCGVDDYNNLYETVNSSTMEQLVSPQGEAILNDGYIEFYVDENNLKEIVKDLFFEKVEK